MALSVIRGVIFKSDMIKVGRKSGRISKIIHLEILIFQVLSPFKNQQLRGMEKNMPLLKDRKESM